MARRDSHTLDLGESNRCHFPKKGALMPPVGYRRRLYRDADRTIGLLTLIKYGGNVSAAARACRMPRPTLVAWRDDMYFEREVLEYHGFSREDAERAGVHVDDPG